MDQLLTIEERLMWAEDPLVKCAGSPVIPGAVFGVLAEQLATYDEVVKTKEEIEDILWEQAKRFTACGASVVDRYATIPLGVIRKNPNKQWQYIIDLIIN